jgi:hypothetical protein
MSIPVPRPRQPLIDLSYRGQNYYDCIERVERALIRKALRISKTKTEASRRLGFKHHQSLIAILNTRFTDIRDEFGFAPTRRRKSLMRPEAKG